MQTKDAVFEKILQIFDIEVKTRDAMLLLQQLLENIEDKKGCKPPVFVIDISEEWTSEDFTRFLIAAKIRGADLKLTRFLIVVSSELSSYRVPICYTDLRCEIFYVPEATEEEAKQLLLKSVLLLKNASGEKLVPENEEDHTTNKYTKKRSRQMQQHPPISTNVACPCHQTCLTCLQSAPSCPSCWAHFQD